MKVVQINAICDIGSTGRTCREFNDMIFQQGHEGIILYGNQSSEYKFARKISSRYEVKFHGLLSRLLGKNASYSPFVTRRIKRFLQAYKPDVVHLRNLHGNYVNIKPLLKHLAQEDIPTVLTLHDCWFFTGKCTHYTAAGCYRWQTGCHDCPKLKADIPSWFFDRTAEMWAEKKKLFEAIPRLAVVGVSDWITGEAKKSFLKNAEIVQRIYNWIDLSLFYPRGRDARRQFGISEEKTAILCIGAGWNERSVKTKDLLKLAQLLPENYEIILAGKVTFTEKLPENIKPVGYFSSKEDLAKLYSACDVYVHLSREDTFGKVIAEAIACGTPAVVYDVTACPEIVGKNCGCVVPVGDVAGVLEAIKFLTSHEKAEWEEICVEYAQEHFSKDLLVTETLELYRKLMEREI